jgi:hypothetical protein
MKLFCQTLLICLTLAATTAQADKWTDADAAFAKRGTATRSNSAVITEARAKYLEILNNATTKTDKIRAVSQLARLAHYYGEMVLDKSATSERSDIFGDCWCKSFNTLFGSCSTPGFVEQINPENLGEEHVAYYYFKGICLAYWGEVQNALTQGRLVGGLDKVIRKGLTMSNLDFEGRAPYRLAAGVYSNPKVKILGYYNIKESTELAEKGVQGVGSEWYDNWWGIISVYQQRHKDEPNDGWDDKALERAEEALETMDGMIANNNKPANRVPEFDHFYDLIKIQYKELAGEEWIPEQ